MARKRIEIEGLATQITALTCPYGVRSELVDRQVPSTGSANEGVDGVGAVGRVSCLGPWFQVDVDGQLRGVRKGDAEGPQDAEGPADRSQVQLRASMARIRAPSIAMARPARCHGTKRKCQPCHWRAGVSSQKLMPQRRAGWQ